jgi:hypothetical protein
MSQTGPETTAARRVVRGLRLGPDGLAIFADKLPPLLITM